jgi:hypothetical protein
MNGHILYLAITIDTDSDVFDSALFPEGFPSGLRWKGIEEGCPLLVKTLRGYRDSFSNSLKFTWFVRADNQLRDACGHAAYLLREYRHIWQTLVKNGDEIGWHPHLYRKSGRRWIQETRPVYLIDDLQQSCQAVREEGFSPISSRIGEGFHSNGIMNELAKLGIKADSTAMPGRVRMDSERSIDWQVTPSHPYYPSKADHRIPGEGEDRIGVLEVPLSMIETKVEYDRYPLRRYIDLSFYNSVIREGLQAYIKGSDYLVSVTHPSTVLALSNWKHPLVSFDIGEVERNFDAILSECGNLGKKVRFVTISEFLDLKG